MIAKASLIFCFGIILTCFINSHGYFILQHVKTGKYINYSGYASDNCSSRRYVFDNSALDKKRFGLLLGCTGRNCVPSNNTMDIQGGCILGRTVELYEVNKDNNQQFKIFPDGTIGTGCNYGWRLTVEKLSKRQIFRAYYEKNGRITKDKEDFKFKVIECK